MLLPCTLALSNSKLLFKNFLVIILLSFLASCGSSSNTSPEKDVASNEASQSDGPDTDESLSNNEGEKADENDQDTQPLEQARVLLAAGSTAPGIDGAILNRIEEVVVTDSGTIAFSANYTLNGDYLFGVWYGPVDSPSLLVKSSDALEGAPSSVRFKKATNLKLSNNGTLGFISELQGSEERSGYAISRNGDISLAILPGRTSVIDNEGETRVIEEVSYADISDYGVALRLKSENKSFVSILKNGNFDFIAEMFDSFTTIATSGCSFYLGIVEKGMSLNDKGDFIFQGFQTGGDACASGDILVRYKDKTFSKILGRTDTLIGSTATVDWKITASRVFETSPTGDILIRTYTKLADREYANSTWSFPESGSPNLIMIDNETVELGTTTGTFRQSFTDDISFIGNQFAIRTKVNNIEGVFAGNVNTGQPHENIALPGASSLQMIVANDSVVPTEFGFPESAFFSDIYEPHLVSENNLFFFAQITDSVTSKVIDDSLWHSNLNGELKKVISTGAQVTINGEIENMKSTKEPDHWTVQQLKNHLVIGVYRKTGVGSDKALLLIENTIQ